MSAQHSINIAVNHLKTNPIIDVKFSNRTIKSDHHPGTWETLPWLAVKGEPKT